MSVQHFHQYLFTFKNFDVIFEHAVQNLPMSLALAATGLRNSATNFLASSRISMMLLSRAKRGARGKDATNRVTKPNWMTGKRKHITFQQLAIVLGENPRLC